MTQPIRTTKPRRYTLHRPIGLGVLVLAACLAVGRVSFAVAADESGDKSPAADAKSGEPQDQSSRNTETEEDESSTGEPAAADLPENPFPNRMQAPNGLLDGGKEWLNASGEITLADLRGKIVLVDFWTYCCINCMHVLPDLKYLEEKYSDELVVIGVHSAKFDNEKDSDNIRQAIVRYDIAHPVINDAEMIVWSKFGARAWPTLALIDPEGYYLGSVSGEGHRELLDEILKQLVAYHKAKGTLDRTSVRFDLERDTLEPTALRFPGKILADGASDRLFIADSGHNRIVVTTLAGKLLDVVGSGATGQADGPFDRASFHHPQGMAFVGGTLYVADTQNHLVRVVDLKRNSVSTLAGTGTQARRRLPNGEQGKLRETALNSPWAVAHVGGTLYVAMAGPHQIWSHEIGTETIRVFAGSGLEDVTNGPLDEAALAQPSGLAYDGEFLYVADSEGSAIRRVGLGVDGQVTTIVGTSDLPRGRSLFEFGDVDAIGEKARLQHPVGVAYHAGTLYVADSYNHKIKKVEIQSRGLSTWLGNGRPGDSLTPAQFSEPHGVSVAAGRLYVADTNNHRVTVADLESDTLAVLSIDGLEAPQTSSVQPAVDATRAPPIRLKPLKLAAQDSLPFQISFSLPDGYKLNTQAPVMYRLTAADAQSLVPAAHLEARHKAALDGQQATFRVPVANDAGTAEFELTVTFGYCRDGIGGLCKMKTLRWLLSVELTPGGEAGSIRLIADARN